MPLDRCLLLQGLPALWTCATLSADSLQVIVKEEFKVTSEVDVEVMHLGHFWTIGEAGLVNVSILDMCEK